MGLCNSTRYTPFLTRWLRDSLESFLSLIISFLVELQHPLLPSLIVTSSQVRVGMPPCLLSCCISCLGPEGLRLGHHFIYLEDYNIQRQMNKQSGFNSEQIEKNNYPESWTVWWLNLKWQVNTANKNHLINKSMSNNKRSSHISLKVLHSLHRLTLGC
jgi:hypothetical protein